MASNQSAQIGANFSDYVGNAGLGSYEGGAFNIDTKPLQNLADYTVLYNRQVWLEKKKDTDLKISQLADLSTISLNDLRDKDKERMIPKLNELFTKASDYARKVPRTEQERLQNELDWQKTFGEFKNDYSSGKQRTLAYHKRLNDIMAGTEDAKAKDAEIKILDKEFADTDIGTPISGVQNFKTEKFDIPNPVTQKFNAIAILGNENIDILGSIYNPKLNAGIADATILGLNKIYPKKGTPEYEKLSENAKNQADIQATVESTGKGWVDAVEPLNSALKKYINADGAFDATSFENDNASSTVLMNSYNALKRYDKDNRDRYNQATHGFFNDKGLSIPLPPNVKADDFKVGFVDFAKGVNANQLVQSGMYAKHTGDVFEKKIQHTGTAKEYAQLNETIRHNKATEFLDSAKQKSDEDKWKASVTGSSTQANGAIERAKRIYADLLKLADTKGVITPDKVRQLNVEQLKYLGIEQPEERDPSTGVITVKGGFRPLDLTTKDENGKVTLLPYVIQLVDGQVRVLSNPVKGKGDYYTGQFDPTKSTNLYNIGTNILNEELQKAGSKELNSYMGIDVTSGVTQTTEGGGTSVSGSTKTSISNSEPISLTGKIDMNTLQIGQPYSVSGKIYIWDGKKLKPQ